MLPGLSPFGLYGLYDPCNLSSLQSFAWDNYTDKALPLVSGIMFYVIQVAERLQNVLPFVAPSALQAADLTPNISAALEAFQQLLLYVLYQPSLSSDPTMRNLIWWEKDTVSDICLARAAFYHVRKSLRLPAPLMDFSETVNDILLNSDNRSAMAQGIDCLKNAVAVERLSHAPVSGLQSSVSLGKRLFEHCQSLPDDMWEGTPCVPTTSNQCRRSGRILRNHFHPPYNSSCDNSTLAESNGTSDISSKVAEIRLQEELNGYCAPIIIPAPPILISSDFCKGSYEELYKGIRTLSDAKEVQEALDSLFKSFTSDGRKADSQGYEVSTAKAMNAIIKAASDTFKKAIPVKTYSARNLTMIKATLSSGSKATKRDPDIINVFIPNSIRPPPGQIKDLGDWSEVRSTGELKFMDQPKPMNDAHLQALTSARQVILHNRDRMSEQAFTCCGGVFKFYYFDAEGFAMSEPYKIFDNQLLFINHVLLLSTFFTGNEMFAKHHPSYARDEQIDGRVEIRGRRVVVYKVRDINGNVRVEKSYWPTIRGSVPREVFVYQHLEDMFQNGRVEDGNNISRMVTHEVLTTTAHIRRVFGVQSGAPRVLVRIILDRHGLSIQRMIERWDELTGGDVWKQCEVTLKLLDGVLAAIGGILPSSCFSVEF